MLGNLSHSCVQTLIECPQKWYQEYVLKKKAPASEAASFGNAFDQLVALKLGIPPKDRAGKVLPDAEVVKIREVEGAQSAVEFYLAQPDAWQGADDAQVKFEITPNQWAGLAEQLGVDSSIHVPMLGYIDLLRTRNAQVQVLDLKTSSRTQFMPKWASQTALYALAKGASLAEIHLMVRLKNGLNFASYQYYPTPDTLRWVLEFYGYYDKVIQRLTAAESGDGIARTPDYYCEWCPVQFECEGSKMRDIRKRQA